jgi:hypothetical protein
VSVCFGYLLWVVPLVEASSGDCHRLFSPSTTTTVKGREREILFYDRNSVVWVTTMLQQQQEQKKQSGSEYSRINYHPARAMMPIPPDIVASNNNNNRTRPAIGVKPIPPPKPFPRPPPSVRPPAALPPRPSSSVSSSCYVTSAGNSLQQQRRRPLTCVNDMAQNPLYMCRLSSLSSPVLSKLVFFSLDEIQFRLAPILPF